MEDEDYAEEEEETFTLELTPSEMYSLSTILKYNSINMEDPAYSRTSEVLAKVVYESMVSDDFDTAMENEVESYKEENDFSGLEANLPKRSTGHGVQ